MAVSRVKTWGVEILTAADLNAEFNNVLNNGTAVAFPLTQTVDCAGFDITGIDELEFTTTAGTVASAAGRLRRSGRDLTWHDGGTPTRIVTVLDRAAASTSVANTTAVAALYTFAVPALTIGQSRTLRYRVIGDTFNNFVASTNLVLTGVWGASTAFTGTIAVTTSAQRHGLLFEWDVAANNTTAAQVSLGRLSITDGATNGTAVTTTSLVARHVALAEDSSSAVNVTIAVQLGTVSANVDCRFHHVLVQLLS